MPDRDPTKRIPTALDTETKLFGRHTLTDVVVGLLPGVLVVLLTRVVLPPELTIAGVPVVALALPVAGVAVAGGALAVYLTPEYTTTLGWLASFVRFYLRPRRQDGEAAREITRFERVHPKADAIERIDGALVGMVQVDPPAMALATDAEWAEKADGFREFLNTVVEFPIQIYSTTRRFPVEEYLAHYESRLSDPDVQENPRLQALIEHYIDWYADELEARRMTIRDHYVIVPVTPAEVRFDSESLTAKLARLPLLGFALRARYEPHAAIEHAAMADELDVRLRRVEAGLREIENVEARRVPAHEATQLVAEFWAGEPLEFGDLGRVLRTRPLVGSDQ